jgi:hypothetical protein
VTQVLGLTDFYVDWGRDPWGPMLMFKIVFLQFLCDLSDRDIEEQCTWNTLFKCSLGLGTEELPPDHLTAAASVSVWGRAKVTVQNLMVALVVNLAGWVTRLKLRRPVFSRANAF